MSPLRWPTSPSFLSLWRRVAVTFYAVVLSLLPSSCSHSLALDISQPYLLRHCLSMANLSFLSSWRRAAATSQRPTSSSFLSSYQISIFFSLKVCKIPRFR
ncbi:hypothetical protein GYH30_007248 [Glycine max]|nr:hypothetical protein GYH30_007248 [Glycine max]